MCAIAAAVKAGCIDRDELFHDRRELICARRSLPCTGHPETLSTKDARFEPAERQRYPGIALRQSSKVARLAQTLFGLAGHCTVARSPC